MISVLTTAVVTIILFVWVVRGFRTPDTDLREIVEDRYSASVERKHGAYRSILDLEEDFAVGKVSVEDREMLAAEYEAEAIAALREIRNEQADVDDEIREQLESEIAAARIALSQSKIPDPPA